MIYVNGERFAAASYAASPYSFSSQDPVFFMRGNLVHPANADVSFATHLGRIFHNPVYNQAWEKNTQQMVFDQTVAAVQNQSIRYAVIVWPSFYRSQIDDGSDIVIFDFSEINSLPENLKLAARQKLSSWNINQAREDLAQKVNELIELFESHKIKYVFAMSENEYQNEYNWLMEQAIKNWAEQNQYLNQYNSLTAVGHQKLSMMLAKQLTSQ